MDECEVAQLARRGEAVEVGLAGVGSKPVGTGRAGRRVIGLIRPIGLIRRIEWSGRSSVDAFFFARGRTIWE
jgi:hypothetical protein